MHTRRLGKAIVTAIDDPNGPLCAVLINSPHTKDGVQIMLKNDDGTFTDENGNIRKGSEKVKLAPTENNFSLVATTDEGQEYTFSRSAHAAAMQYMDGSTLVDIEIYHGDNTYCELYQPKGVMTWLNNALQSIRLHW